MYFSYLSNPFATEENLSHRETHYLDKLEVVEKIRSVIRKTPEWVSLIPPLPPECSYRRTFLSSSCSEPAQRAHRPTRLHSRSVL